MTTTASGVTFDGSLRLDKWLVVSRFCKTRSQATDLIGSGRLRINRQIIQKAHHQVRIGDVLTFPLGPYIRVIEVLAMAKRRGPAREAQLLYRDLSPPEDQPRPDRQLARAEMRPAGAGRPTKKQRRATDRLKSGAPQPPKG